MKSPRNFFEAFLFPAATPMLRAIFLQISSLCCLLSKNIFSVRKKVLLMAAAARADTRHMCKKVELFQQSTLLRKKAGNFENWRENLLLSLNFPGQKTLSESVFS